MLLPRTFAGELAPLLALLDLFGIAVFAASGALAAARAKQTLVTFTFFALVTGVGGGTVRDLLIGAPVFWIAKPAYLAWKDTVNVVGKVSGGSVTDAGVITIEGVSAATSTGAAVTVTMTPTMAGGTLTWACVGTPSKYFPASCR